MAEEKSLQEQEQEQEYIEQEEQVDEVTDDAEDEIELHLGDKRYVFTPDELEELVRQQEKVRELEKENSRLREYEGLARYVASDELVNRVALYRMQGNSPAEIVLFLYNHMVETGMIDPYNNSVTEAGKTIQVEQRQQDIDTNLNALQEEVRQLRSYIQSQSVYNTNTEVLGRVLAEMDWKVDVDEHTVNILQEVSKEILGDPNYLLKYPINQQQAKVLIRELKERLSTSKPSNSNNKSVKKVIVRQAKNLPDHFPAKTRSSASSSKREMPKEYSLQNAALAYRALFED